MFLTVKNKFLDISHVKAVIFDMDGTLVESEHIWAEAKKDVARSVGINITDSGLSQYIGRGINDFIDEVLQPTNIQNRADLAQKIHEKVLIDYGSKIRVIEGALDILTAFSLAGVRLAICSSGSLPAIESSLELLNATKLVEVVVSGDTLATGKPHPLPYLRTLEKLHLDAKNTIVFEDTIAGFQSATAAGISTVIVGAQADSPSFSSAALIDPLLSNFSLSTQV